MTNYARRPSPGPDQMRAWKAALAASRRQQRRRRPQRGIETVTRAGMMRQPAPDHPAPGGAARKGTA